MGDYRKWLCGLIRRFVGDDCSAGNIVLTFPSSFLAFSFSGVQFFGVFDCFDVFWLHENARKWSEAPGYVFVFVLFTREESACVWVCTTARAAADVSRAHRCHGSQTHKAS